MGRAEGRPAGSLSESSVLDNGSGAGPKVGRQMLQGSAWSFGINALQQVLVLTRLVVLARLLLPLDFGILDIAVLTIYALDVLSQTGFQQALVQKKADITADLNAAWTLLVLRGVVLFLTLFLLAPLIAGFFSTPEATPVLQVIGLSLMFQGFTNLGTIHFLKDLDFRRQYLFKLSGVLADFIVSITAVVVLHNVWALVLGILAKDLTLMVASYLVHPYRPRLNFDLSKVLGLSNYGVWIMLSSILTFFLLEGDDVVVGRVLGVTALGLYQMAYGLSNTPSTEISQIISQVAFPVYAKIQDDNDQLRALFLRTLRLTALISFILTGLLVSLSPEIAVVFLGTSWSPIVPLVQVLAWWGLVRGLGETAAALFMAVGRPRTYALLQLVQVVLLFSLIYPLMTGLDLVGVSLAVALSSLPMLYLTVRALRATIGVDAREVYGTFLYPLALAISGIASTAALRIVLISPDVLSFLTLLAAYVATALVVIHLLDRYTRYKAWSMVRSFLSERQGASDGGRQ